MSTQNILESLRAETDSALTKLESAGTVDIDAKMAELETKMTEAVALQDDQERDIRVKTLQADFETLRAALQAEEQDLSQAVLGLNALMNEMGSEYQDLMEPSAQEAALIKAAQSAVQSAQSEVQKIEDKPGWMFIFSSREKQLRAARDAVATAEKGVQTAQVEAKKLARDRLMKATMEESLQQFMFKVEKTIQIMSERRKEIQHQLDAVSHRKIEAYRIKEESAEALESLDAQLNQQESALQSAEQELDTLVNGSAEYVAKEQEVSALRREVEGLRGKRNQALVLFQSKERFAAELDVHEKSQLKLRDNQDAWITLLKSDTEERLITFKSRLEAMKAMSDQDVAQNLDNLGVAIDKSNVEFMTQVGAASDKRRMELIESQPDRIRKIEEARAAQAEAQARIRDREQAALEEFRKRYNIDPLDSSFFTYAEKDEK